MAIDGAFCMDAQGVGIRISVEGLENDQTTRADRPGLVERDERHWYGEGWRQLRRNLVRLCLSKSSDLLYVLCSEKARPDDIAQAVHAFVDKVLDAIDKRARATSHADIWRHSLRLLALPDMLSDALISQRKRFASTDLDHDPEAMLGATLKFHFETVRRDLQTEHSPHRLKVWEQINRASQDVRGLNDDPSTLRSIEHLEVVLAALKERYPNSRNLPRSIETLEGYFFEFSRFHEPESLDSDHGLSLVDDQSMAFDDLDFLEDVTGMKPDPIGCFEALPKAHAEAFAAAHRLMTDLLPDIETPFTSARAYYLTQGISKRRFHRLLREATDLLIACLENKILRVP
jgi:hypothetical protein